MNDYEKFLKKQLRVSETFRIIYGILIFVMMAVCYFMSISKDQRIIDLEEAIMKNAPSRTWAIEILNKNKK